jgi:hypothetical protein
MKDVAILSTCRAVDGPWSVADARYSASVSPLFVFLFSYCTVKTLQFGSDNGDAHHALLHNWQQLKETYSTNLLI